MNKEKIIVIDRSFADGLNLLSYPGRNDDIIKLALDIVREDIENVLIIGCGPYELWTTGGQAKIRSKKTVIVGVDISKEIAKINQIIKERGIIPIKDIIPLVSDPLFGLGSSKNIIMHRNIKSLLERLNIKGVYVENDLFIVDQKNRENVYIEQPMDVLEYIKKKPSYLYSLIFSGNIENNLIFQNGYTFDRSVNFHKMLVEILKPGGIYAFTTNEIFFHNSESNNSKNILQVLEKSGLEILYKATQLAFINKSTSKSIIVENCGLITARRGDFNSFLNATAATDTIRKIFMERYPEIESIEEEGSYDKFKDSLKKQTNLILIKINGNNYYWFNIKGEYKDVFMKLARLNFFPELFTVITDLKDL